ncbi:hypothetical protein J4437_03970 [Candidatus Woesearchaeota archaeon]|nr:hypothetical protein [uncultured archaeon]MBS3123768.1 hypothetical protein [Candidatus Woesearchaeota archaeon]
MANLSKIAILTAAALIGANLNIPTIEAKPAIQAESLRSESVSSSSLSSIVDSYCHLAPELEAPHQNSPFALDSEQLMADIAHKRADIAEKEQLEAILSNPQLVQVENCLYRPSKNLEIDCKSLLTSEEKAKFVQDHPFASSSEPSVLMFEPINIELDDSALNQIYSKKALELLKSYEKEATETYRYIKKLGIDLKPTLYNFYQELFKLGAGLLKEGCQTSISTLEFSISDKHMKELSDRDFSGAYISGVVFFNEETFVKTGAHALHTYLHEYGHYVHDQLVTSATGDENSFEDVDPWLAEAFADSFALSVALNLSQTNAIGQLLSYHIVQEQNALAESIYEPKTYEDNTNKVEDNKNNPKNNSQEKQQPFTALEEHSAGSIALLTLRGELKIENKVLQRLYDLSLSVEENSSFQAKMEERHKLLREKYSLPVVDKFDLYNKTKSLERTLNMWGRPRRSVYK